MYSKAGLMRYSTRLSDALHILVYISLNPDVPITSTDIAESVQTNPAYIRKLMAQLKSAGLISGSRGKSNPELLKDAGVISLLDVYRAIEGEKPLLHLDTHVNPECNVGLFAQAAIQSAYDQVQRSAEETMKSIKLNDIANDFEQRSESNEAGIHAAEPGGANADKISLRNIARPPKTAEGKAVVTPEMRALADALAHPKGDPYLNGRDLGFYCEQCG